MSRAKTEFKIQRPLGSGGFGTTFLVTHLLDQKDYALKVVEIPRDTHEEERKKIMREVELLSSLQCSNVVRYNSAWVEEGVPRDFGMETNGSDDEFSSSSSSSLSSSSRRGACLCVCDKCKGAYKDWEIGFEKWGLLDAVLQPLNLCQNCYLDEIPSAHREAAEGSLREKKVEEVGEFLFILMEYCEQSFTQQLEHLRAMDSDDDRESGLWALFADCITGLSHLHSLGVIHRDIKTSNIFVREGVGKLGDLGLATQGNNAEGSSGSGGAGDEGSKSTDIGTYLYVAPEVSTGRYTTSCDIYSLGVVLLEMFSIFSTAMERVSVLTDLRRGFVKSAAVPENALHLILRMTNQDERLRPTCKDILQELVVHNSLVKPSYDQLSAVVENQHNELERLRALLDHHGVAY